MVLRPLPWVVMLASLATAGCHREPSTFEDCVLAYVKPGMTNDVAGIVVQACRNKFPAADW